MKMNQQYKQEYITFLNDIFENNYAEEVPQEELTVSRESLVHTTLGTKEVRTLDLDKDSLLTERTLGLQWCVDSDHFQFNIHLNQKPHSENSGTQKYAQLHHFADASENCYGSVSYIRQVNIQDVVHVSFVLGKSRVLPLKQITVPRLELAAAALLVKVGKMLKRELHLDLNPSVFWTDSQTVLKYIGNELLH